MTDAADDEEEDGTSPGDVVDDVEAFKHVPRSLAILGVTWRPTAPSPRHNTVTVTPP